MPSALFFSELETTLFRLVQESLTNIHRHSGSKTAAVRLHKGEKEVRLEISDEGKGFASTASTRSDRPRPGVGILGMKERVRRFGGNLDIASSAAGTCIRVRLSIDTAPVAPSARPA